MAAQAQDVRLAAPDHNDAGAAMDLAFGCDLKGFGQSQGAMTVLKVPGQPFDDLDLLPRAGSDRRRLPLATDGRWSRSWTGASICPGATCWPRCRTAPRSRTGSGRCAFSASAADSSVRFASRIELKLATVPPERYAQLRELLDAYHAPARWHLLLERTKKD